MRDDNGETRHPKARGGPAAGASAKRARSVRFQLLFAVNAVLRTGLLSLLVLDYARERRQRLHDRQVALSEEANLLLPIISQLQSQGTRAVQEYLDRACRRVQDATSPAHHLAVRTGQKLLQARTHGSVSPTVLKAATAARPGTSGRAQVDGRLILIGSAGSGELRVWVSEYAEEILAASRWQLLTRSLEMGVLGLLVTGVTSIVIVRLVSRPVEQLAATVRRIGRGEFQAVAEPAGGAEFQFLLLQQLHPHPRVDLRPGTTQQVLLQLTQQVTRRADEIADPLVTHPLQRRFRRDAAIHHQCGSTRSRQR